MEKRIISFENGIAVVEEVKTLTLSETDINAKEAELETRKLGATNAIEAANKELEKIAQEEKELADAKAILAEAHQKFAPAPVSEETPVQEQLPLEEISRGI